MAAFHARLIMSLIVLFLAGTMRSPAQTLTTLANFDSTNGKTPEAALVRGSDGNYYGTTNSGGAHNVGTVFRVTPTGSLTTLYSFCSRTNCTDGSYPTTTPLVRAASGNFYGLTSGGGTGSGACAGGTFFQITPSGVLTTLYSFGSKTNCADGNSPNALVLAKDGNFYGTTQLGGDSTCRDGSGMCGIVFKMTPAGVLTVLYSFCSLANCADGVLPSGLTQGKDGNFYGTTSYGGAPSNSNCTSPVSDCGTVFKITPEGVFKTLHSFTLFDGAGPQAPVQANNGNLYGTTSGGGTYSAGTIFEITGGTTVTTFFNFSVCSKGGRYPQTQLIQANDGNLYGTTPFYCNQGTIYNITLNGQPTRLHTFNGADGSMPNALVQAPNGTFLGTTNLGGTHNDGTVFKLGLFAETTPTSGKVGSAVTIYSTTSLASATGVSFNGTPSSFSVSGSDLKTTVPSGATTGFVTVTLSNRTLTSDRVFQVTP